MSIQLAPQSKLIELYNGCCSMFGSISAWELHVMGSWPKFVGAAQNRWVVP